MGRKNEEHRKVAVSRESVYRSYTRVNTREYPEYVPYQTYPCEGVYSWVYTLEASIYPGVSKVDQGNGRGGASIFH